MMKALLDDINSKRKLDPDEPVLPNKEQRTSSVPKRKAQEQAEGEGGSKEAPKAPKLAVLSSENAKELAKKIKASIQMSPKLTFSIAEEGDLVEGSGEAIIKEFKEAQGAILRLLNSDMPEGVPESVYGALSNIKDKALKNFLKPYIQGTYTPAVTEAAEVALEETLSPEEEKSRKDANEILKYFIKLLYGIQDIYDANGTIKSAISDVQKEILNNTKVAAADFFKKNMPKGISATVWEHAKKDPRLLGKSEDTKRAFECFLKNYREEVYQPVADVVIYYHRPQLLKKLEQGDYNSIKEELISPLQTAWENMMKQAQHTVRYAYMDNHLQLTTERKKLSERNIDAVFSSYKEPYELPESEGYRYAVPKAVQLMSFTTERFDKSHIAKLNKFKQEMQHVIRDHMQELIESAALIKDKEGKFFAFTSPIGNADVYGEKSLEAFETAYGIVIEQIMAAVPENLSVQNPFAFELERFHASMTLNTVENQRKIEVHTALGKLLKGDLESQEGFLQAMRARYRFGTIKFSQFWKDLGQQLTAAESDFKKPNYMPVGDSSSLDPLESQVRQFLELISLDTIDNQHRKALQQTVKESFGEEIDVEDKQQLASVIRQKYKEQEDPFGRFLTVVQARLADGHPFKTQARPMPAISEATETVITALFPRLSQERQEALKQEIAEEFRRAFISKKQEELEQYDNTLIECASQFQDLMQLERDGTLVELLTKLYETKPVIAKEKAPPQQQEKKEDNLGFMRQHVLLRRASSNMDSNDQDSDEEEPVTSKTVRSPEELEVDLAKTEQDRGQAPINESTTLAEPVMSKTVKSREELKVDLAKALQDRDQALINEVTTLAADNQISLQPMPVTLEEYITALEAGVESVNDSEIKETLITKIAQLRASDTKHKDAAKVLRDEEQAQIEAVKTLADDNQISFQTAPVTLEEYITALEAGVESVNDSEIKETLITKIAQLRASDTKHKDAVKILRDEEQARIEAVKTLADDNHISLQPAAPTIPEEYITAFEKGLNAVVDAKKKEILTAKISDSKKIAEKNKQLVDQISQADLGDLVTKVKELLSFKHPRDAEFKMIGINKRKIEALEKQCKADIPVARALLEALQSPNYKENRFLAIAYLLPSEDLTDQQRRMSAVNRMLAGAIVAAIQKPKLAEMEEEMKSQPWYPIYTETVILEQYTKQAKELIEAADKRVEALRAEAVILREKCVIKRRERLKLGLNDLSEETQKELEDFKTKILLCPQLTGNSHADTPYGEVSKDIKSDLTIADQKIEVVSTDRQQQIDALVLAVQRQIHDIEQARKKAEETHKEEMEQLHIQLQKQASGSVSTEASGNTDRVEFYKQEAENSQNKHYDVLVQLSQVLTITLGLKKQLAQKEKQLALVSAELRCVTEDRDEIECFVEDMLKQPMISSAEMREWRKSFYEEEEVMQSPVKPAQGQTPHKSPLRSPMRQASSYQQIVQQSRIVNNTPSK